MVDSVLTKPAILKSSYGFMHLSWRYLGIVTHTQILSIPQMLDDLQGFTHAANIHPCGNHIDIMYTLGIYVQFMKHIIHIL